jgi:hypothetical protein
MWGSIIDGAIQILVPIVGWMFKKSTSSDELKAEFYAFVKQYTNERDEVGGARQTGKTQDADLDEKLKQLGGKQP